jgi:Tfp pilus assembly protein PilV
MIEVLFAMIILSVGLIALSSLAAQSLNGTATSRYMSLASTYASEKLEDLNHWPTTDPHVCVASGATAGSLTSDVQAASVTCNGYTDTIDYYDDVQIGDANGASCETTSGLSSGSLLYTTTCHTPGGSLTTTTSPTANTSDQSAIAFHRRWTIEMDQPVTGIKRITVLVTLENGYVQPGVSFQMSMVRP